MGMMDALRGLMRFERRSARLSDPMAAALLGVPMTSSGIAVTPRLAENLSTVMACVSAIAGAIASLPVYVYRRTDGGRHEDEGHPLAQLVRDGPNQWQTWPDFIEWLMASLLLRGNALAEVVTDGAGALVGLLPVPWERVTVVLLPNGSLAYDIAPQVGPYGATGRTRRLLAEEVVHLRDRSDDGLVGRSRLNRAADSIGLALALQDASGALWRNGAAPKGVLEHPGRLSPEAIDRIRNTWSARHGGPGNYGKPAVLEEGMKWAPVSINPEDAEMLGSRRLSAEELARIFQVPPPIAGIWDHSSFSNAETAGRWFATHTLAPHVAKLEAAFVRTLLTAAGRATHSIEFDLSGLMRGDPEARWRSHEIALKNAVLTPNEVRQVEGWNRRQDGDEVVPARPADPAPPRANRDEP